jgi:hypothetical protein
MADEPIEQVGVTDREARREWVKPQVHDMIAGDAELGGDTSIDGDPGLS